MNWKSKTCWSYTIYSLLALLVLLPLLKPGFILSLDMVFTPHLRLPAAINNSYLLYGAMHLLNVVLPSDLIEKIILFLILFLSGLGMHRLIISLQKEEKGIYDQLGAYFGGTLYMINPFTYDRFMAGQYAVLLGYALLPWFLRALLDLLARPGIRHTLILTLWALAISIVSIHSIGLIVLLSLILISVHTWQRRRDTPWLRQLAKCLIAALVLCVIASSYWLIPLTTGKGSTASTITSFTIGDRQAFATVGGSVIGQVRNVARLQGFWLEARGMYTLPQQHLKLWGALALILWTLIILGVINLWRTKQRFQLVIWSSSLLLAIILAIGAFSSWLADHLPLFAGYREPQKFVALIALTYAVLAARGISLILSRARAQYGRLFALVGSLALLALPLIWTSSMLWGFNGQLKPEHYPSDWYTVNTLLDQDSSRFKTLFLPWHLYMAYDFSERIIANPAPKFFDKPMIVSNNPEFKGAASNPDTTASNINLILRSADSATDLGSKLAPYHVKYILLAREYDYNTYDYLHRQSDLQLVHHSATLELYRNNAFKE